MPPGSSCVGFVPAGVWSRRESCSCLCLKRCSQPSLHPPGRATSFLVLEAPPHHSGLAPFNSPLCTPNALPHKGHSRDFLICKLAVHCQLPERLPFPCSVYLMGWGDPLKVVQVEATPVWVPSLGDLSSRQRLRVTSEIY